MRQIIKKKLIISILIILFICCNFVEAKNDNYFSIKEKSKEQIKLGSAEKIAYMKLNELEKSEDYFINDIRIIYADDSSKELFFIFNLLPKGFLVISANYNLPPIIAYSFSNDIYGNPNDNFLIELLKADINLRLDNIEKIPDYILHERNSKWDNYLKNNDEVLYLDFEQWPPEGTTPTDGWIITTWNQNSPYNDFCPLDPSSGTRSIAGCPAVTMSQILNYHKTINNVFFNDTDDYLHNYVNRYWIDNDHEEYDFPSFPELNEYLSVLNDHYVNEIVLTDEDKAALNFACGIAAKQVYTGSASGTFGVNQAYDAYIKFNCDNIELIDNDDSDLYDRISQNIKEGYPVHLAVVTPAWDSGHNLIIDGYNTDDFYHLNFGWGGQYDAWYQLPNEIPYGLTVIEGVIVDILFNDNRSDLSCNGKLSWIDVSPGTTLYGNFTIENIGVSESFLNWSIESVPDWGTWELTPSSGSNLTPDDGSVKVEVKVVAPDKKGKEYIGGIKIVNEEFRGDSHYIQVTLITPKIHNTFNIDFFKFIVKYQNSLPKILHYFL